MNARRNSPWAWSTCRKTLCAAGLAVLAGSACADEAAAVSAKAAPIVRAAIPAVRSWTEPTLPMSWNPMGHADEWYPDDSYMTAMDNFDSGRLFRTRKELLYRDTLRLLLTKRQLRVWLRDNLHVQGELKRWRTADDGRELGLKLGVYYRFD